MLVRIVAGCCVLVLLLKNGAICEKSWICFRRHVRHLLFSSFSYTFYAMPLYSVSVVLSPIHIHMYTCMVALLCVLLSFSCFCSATAGGVRQTVQRFPAEAVVSSATEFPSELLCYSMEPSSQLSLHLFKRLKCTHTPFYCYFTFFACGCYVRVCGGGVRVWRKPRQFSQIF